MSDTIVGTYPHKLAAKHALSSAGYKRCKEYGDFHRERWRKQHHELCLVDCMNGKWLIEQAGAK